MAKSLERIPPSSSVARHLDMGAASRAITLMPAPDKLPRTNDSYVNGAMHEESARGSPETTANIPCIKREVILTPFTEEVLVQLVSVYRRATGTRLSTSHVIRSMLLAVAHAMASLQRDAEQIGRLRLPANAPGNQERRHQFEWRIAEAFVAGMRDSAALATD